MNGNDFMSWVLRSPLHGMLSKSMMLITVTGCKTGKQYTTPVEYYDQGGYLWVITSRNRTWWRNLKVGAEVSLLLRCKAVSAFGEAVLDESEVEAQLREYVTQMPVSARALGLLENNVPNEEAIKRMVKDRLFVRLTLR
jgi:deazaflavin-dependent oxidoreductase (nitroreductase family)